ncbi:cytochrome d ubiquinol oxidase subunit II [Helicobacter sp.]|uniref:cytochrome d ubiquinol oxidase subunit II n=1 Tax=Helicobacter sp. TaxID=218 RepID=UPI003890ABB9
MFFGLDLAQLQAYWWVVVSLLGGLLVFMFFVQGGQGLIDRLSSNEEEKTLIINSLGRKWELGFTTLVLFGGACFAAFPLFYSTSFGGAYWVWLAILLCFIIQAVSYEYRKKQGNLLGAKTYETFLKINGILGVFLIGVAVSTFFAGSAFVLDDMRFVRWEHGLHGLEQLGNPFNYLLGFALVFLSRILADSYFLNALDSAAIAQKAKKDLALNTALFLPFFLGFLAWICLKDGFHVDESGAVSMLPYLYLQTFLSQPYILILLLVGVVCVLGGIYLSFIGRKGIFPLGFGVVCAVMAVFLNVGLGESAFYPSSTDLQSSLTIANASSSYYTLSVMSYVSLLVPFVLGYIVYVWRCMDSKKLGLRDMDEHAY